MISSLPASPNKEQESLNNGIVGCSAAITNVHDSLRRVSQANGVPVLISGESGTGKELAAIAIHRHSSRAAGPFVAVNCGALPSSLIQSELFGHEKGAFTGAQERSVGRLEAADGGTVFLDEIGDLSVELQVNLLRFLQEKTIERLGSAESIQLDTRVIAATNLDLEQQVAKGLFREDLYYRLNVLEINMPALREREDDVIMIAEFYLRQFSLEIDRKVLGFTPQAKNCLRNYAWPGNIRELINRVHRAVIMFDEPIIGKEALGLFDISEATSPSQSLAQARREAERRVIISSLGNNHQNVSAAARQLRVTRTTMYRLMDKFGIEPRQKEKSDDKPEEVYQ